MPKLQVTVKTTEDAKRQGEVYLTASNLASILRKIGVKALPTGPTVNWVVTVEDGKNGVFLQWYTTHQHDKGTTASTVEV